MHLNRLESEGKFPRRVQLGAGTVAWVAEEIDAFVAAKLAERDKAEEFVHVSRLPPQWQFAPLLSDNARIELNRLSLKLVRCTDQAECDKIAARMAEIEKLPPVTEK
jgi:Prophage CP4-57 regulatory protein (AlpA)